MDSTQGKVRQFVCGRCGSVDSPVITGKLVQDPEGWGEITLTGNPVRNARLCPECVGIVSREIWGPYSADVSR